MKSRILLAILSFTFNLITFFGAITVHANPEIDSLKQVFEQLDSKSSVIWNIENIMQEAAGSLDEDVFDFLFDLGIEYAIELKADTSIANLYFERGTNYLDKGEYDLAEKDYLVSLEYYANVPVKDYGDQVRYAEAYVYSNLGIINKVQGAPYLALKNYFSAVEVFEELNDTMRTASIYLNIANLYDQHDEFASANKYFKKARAYFQAIGYKKGIATAKINFSSSLVENNKLEQGKSELLSAVLICEEIDNQYVLAYAMNQLSDVYIKLNKSDSAKIYTDKALEIYTQLNDSAGIAGVYFNYGNYYKSIGYYKKSEEWFLNSMAISERHKMISFVEEIAKELSGVYIQLNDYEKAYNQLNLYDSLKTISNSANLKRQLSEVEELHESNTFKKQLKESENEIGVLNNKLKNFKLISGILTLLVVILLILSFIKRRKRNTYPNVS